jgi:hypothetical protein
LLWGLLRHIPLLVPHWLNCLDISTIFANKYGLSSQVVSQKRFKSFKNYTVIILSINLLILTITVGEIKGKMSELPIKEFYRWMIYHWNVNNYMLIGYLFYIVQVWCVLLETTWLERPYLFAKMVDISKQFSLYIQYYAQKNEKLILEKSGICIIYYWWL